METPWRNKTEMAQYYRCDIKTITNWMRRRILPFVKIGRYVRFDLRECDQAMDKFKRRSSLIVKSVVSPESVPPPTDDVHGTLRIMTVTGSDNFHGWST
jgi:hypothetical protein